MRRMLDSGRHYERAFESVVRGLRLPYISVREARRSLAPNEANLRLPPREPCRPARTLKSFDFVVYSEGPALLVDVKGRRVGGSRRPETPSRLETWVTRDDLASLDAWAGLFGADFTSAFAFVHWWKDGPPANGPDRTGWCEHEGRAYTVRVVPVADFRQAMRLRSPRWETVELAPGALDRLSRPLRPWSEAAASPHFDESRRVYTANALP